VTRVVACGQQQLRVNSELKFRLLVVQEAPLHSEHEIACPRGCALAVLLHDFNRKFQLQLHVGQSVIEVEQRRGHFGFSQCALDDERQVYSPSPRWWRLRVFRDKWRTRLSGTNGEEQADTRDGAANFRPFAEEPESARHLFMCQFEDASFGWINEVC